MEPRFVGLTLMVAVVLRPRHAGLADGRCLNHAKGFTFESAYCANPRTNEDIACREFPDLQGGGFGLDWAMPLSCQGYADLICQEGKKGHSMFIENDQGFE